MKQVVIIGGGITGAYAAYLAALQKLPVKLFETLPKKRWLCNPLSTRKCGEGVWHRKLQNAGVSLERSNAPEWIENSTTTLLLGRHFQNSKIEFWEGKIEPYLFLNRQKFILSLQKKSATLGAEWHFGENITDPENIQGDSLIVSAWGTNPTLLSKVIKDKFEQEYLLACQYSLSRVDSSKVRNAKVIVLSDDPIIRYFYLFPKSNGRSVEANLGVVFNKLSITNSFARLDNLLKLNFRGALEKAKILPERSFAKIVCAGPPVKNNATLLNLLLIGDAGFTTDPISTGGIGFGLLAAKFAIGAATQGDSKKAFHEKMAPLWKKLKKSYKLAKKLYPSNQSEKKKVNDLYFRKVKEVLKTGGYLSLGNIVRQILA